MSPPADTLSILEAPTAAPAVGDVLATFSSRLDGRNPLRLPSVSADAGTLGPFWVAAASCTGLFHLDRATTGDDHYSFSLAADEAAVVVAVASGSGSRPGTGHITAAASARLFCSCLARRSSSAVGDAPDETIRQALVEVDDELRRFRHVLVPHLAGEDLSATLAFCWIPREYERRATVAGRVGDCAAFTVQNGVYRSAFPRAGDLNVVGGSLSGHHRANALDVELLDLHDERVVVLATDGVAGDLFGSPAVRTWLAERWSGPCGPFHMLDSLRYRRRGSHGDRTALVVWLDPWPNVPDTGEGTGRARERAP